MNETKKKEKKLVKGCKSVSGSSGGVGGVERRVKSHLLNMMEFYIQ